MRLLHTSDWHIGRTLYGRKRYEEFEAFLEWLANTIKESGVNVLLVAGDVFDTSVPGNRSQEIYYRFLCRVAASSCRHIIIVAGNHDSPSFLNAPGKLLKALNIHVVGSVCDPTEDEVLELTDESGTPELIVCAVPYLRDRDIRSAGAGECFEDKHRNLLEGIRCHYQAISAIAWLKQTGNGSKIPMICMGHLFTSGGKTVEGDGVRELYVGSLAHVAADIFPEHANYVALGHLHVPQKVNNSSIIRYSGSPLPMGFGESGQIKNVCLADLEIKDSEIVTTVQLIDVPVFQKLERIKGNLEQILKRLDDLSAEDSSVWIEVIYEGEAVIENIRERLSEAIAATKLEILTVKNSRIISRVLEQIHAQETLEDLSCDEVFERCLNAHDIKEIQRKDLMIAYQEVVLSVLEEESGL